MGTPDPPSQAEVAAALDGRGEWISTAHPAVGVFGKLADEIADLYRRWLGRQPIDHAEVRALMLEVEAAGRWRVEEFGSDEFAERRVECLDLLRRMHRVLVAGVSRDDTVSNGDKWQDLPSVQGVANGAKWHAVTTATVSDERLRRNARQARLDAGLSQPQLGELIGVDRIRISKMENGHNRITIPTLERIAEATGKPESWFFEDHSGDE
jgi:DNA-binding XRE family transcriptional regulator